MASEGGRWSGWLPDFRGRSHSTRRHRRRPRDRFGRLLTRLLSSFSLGVLLVGCANTKPSSLDTLSSSHISSERASAYRSCALAESMSEAERQQALDALVHGATKESSPLLRAAATESLRGYHEHAAVEAIKKSARDDEPMVRIAACRALADHGDDWAIALLAQTATLDNNVDVRIAAVETLAGWDDPVCRRHLAECLDDDDPVVVRIASNNLRDMTGKAFPNDKTMWIAYLDGKSVDEPKTETANRQHHGAFKKFVR